MAAPPLPPSSSKYALHPPACQRTGPSHLLHFLASVAGLQAFACIRVRHKQPEALPWRRPIQARPLVCSMWQQAHGAGCELRPTQPKRAPCIRSVGMVIWNNHIGPHLRGKGPRVTGCAAGTASVLQFHEAVMEMAGTSSQPMAHGTRCKPLCEVPVRSSTASSKTTAQLEQQFRIRIELASGIFQHIHKGNHSIPSFRPSVCDHETLF